MFFRVNARVINRGEMKEVFFIAGNSEYNTLADVYDDLIEFGMIHVVRYDTRTVPGQPAVRQIVSEYETIINAKDGFTTISEMIDTLVGPRGEVLYQLPEERNTSAAIYAGGR